MNFCKDAMLTDATLKALARNCPHLVHLAVDWNVNSLESVCNAATMLARLTRFSASESRKERRTLPFALKFLRDVVSLFAYDVPPMDVAASFAVAARCTQLRYFLVQNFADAALVDLAREIQDWKSWK